MNILMVDDNPYVLEGLKAGIDFAKLGITKVFTAKCMREAIELLECEDISLVLTDIEMPNGTGLQLLEWIQGHKPDVVTLFCTNYADFDYAQKAVELHCFGYYLKPVQYDVLQDILSKAVDEIRSRIAVKEKEKLGEYWLANLKEQKRHFWEDLLLRIDNFDERNPEQFAADMHLPYDKSSVFALGFLRFEREKSRMDKISKDMERFIMNNVLTELLENSGLSMEIITKCRKDTWALVMQYQSYVDKASVQELFERIVEQVRQLLKCYVNGYYFYRCGLMDVRQGYDRLEEAYRDHIYGTSKIIDIETYQKTVTEYDLSLLPEWEELFRRKETGQLLYSIQMYLVNLENNNQLNQHILRGVQISVTQMVYTILWEKKIDAGMLYHEAYFEDMLERATTSVDNLLNYLSYIFSQGIGYMEYSRKTDTVANQIKTYIDEHYNEDITCEMLGETVYLSSGYLAKIFKQETGKSLGVYVIDKRIEKAKTLLLSGDMSVSEVAIAVGYDNFSYFSRLFKNKVGVSPKEYKDKISGGT